MSGAPAHRRGGRLAAVLLPLAIVLIFFWVPDDADQGFSQRIFYIHVPVALTSYVFFGVGAFFAARYLLRRDEADDLRSYVGIHVGIIFGTLVLLTGPIWARISLGRLVELVRRAAERLPDPLPVLCGLLHAPLLARPRPAAVRLLRGLRAARRRA